ncbi:ABC transporter permease [Zhihengliuella halotolerans]|uniref:ABC transporter permease n=1 Tax=Zhihengliuella halotolerans TaxID=370736 RepID=UPI000C80571E|nr:ABC transporter permease [Zhihengliuella halotolerans]
MRLKQHMGRWLVPVLGGLAFVYLLVPIAYIFVFSFNDAGRTNLTWQGFTFSNWQNPCGAPNICDALGNSLSIAFVATIIATVLGTAIALGLARYKFRFRKLADILIILPLATPEVVLGASLLAQFLNLGWQLGYWTVVISHVTFCMAFVVVTVRARVSSLDGRLEEAAGDLYASPRTTFWKVTFPLLLPGIMAAALLSFAMSFDDFIIANFNSGTFDTFPKFIYVAATRGIPAQANVIGSGIFLIALALVVVGTVISYRRQKALAAR